MYQISVFIHVLSAIGWVGGMLFLALVVVPATRPLPPAERAALIDTVGRRFRPIGWSCIALLVVTGLIISGYRGITWEAVTSGQVLEHQFGRLLSLKVGLVVVMTVLSLVHDLVIGPASTRAHERRDHPDRIARLRRVALWMARLSLLLALAIVALAVALVRGWPG